MNKRIAVAVGIGVVLAIAVSVALTRPAGEADAGDAAPIVIDQFAYGGNLTFSTGEMVTVNNIDGAQHTLTSADGLFDTEVLDAKAGTSTFVAPTEAGSYPFFCSIHPSMTGTMVVTG